MIAVTNMWFEARITRVRPAEASGRTPESSSDQECLCVVAQRASHADRCNFWESASAAGAVSCWHTNKVFCWTVNAPEITPEIWIPFATQGRAAVPFSLLFPEVTSQVRVSPLHLSGHSSVSQTFTGQAAENFLVLLKYITYVHTLY